MELKDLQRPWEWSVIKQYYVGLLNILRINREILITEKLSSCIVGFYLESLRSMETISSDVFSFFRQVLDLIPLTQTLVYHIFFFFCLSVFATVFSNVQETPLPQLESLYSFLSQRVSISELSSIVLLFFYCLLTHRSCSCKLIPTSTPSPISPV